MSGQAQSDGIQASDLSPLKMIQLDAEGLEAFRFLTSELFDLAVSGSFDLGAARIVPGNITYDGRA